MKRFEELTQEQKDEAVETFTGELLEAIVGGLIRFDDEKNGDTFQAAIDLATAKASEMQTPWFAGEYVMDARFYPGDGHIVEDDGLYPVSNHIRGMATVDAEDAFYLEDGETAIALRSLRS